MRKRMQKSTFDKNWVKDKDYRGYQIPPKFGNDIFSNKMTKRLIELERKYHIKKRWLELEKKQINGLEKQVFISIIHNGTQFTSILEGNKIPIINKIPTKSKNDSVIIIKSQEINRKFTDLDYFEIWILRRLQLSSMKDSRKEFGESKIELLKEILDLFYKVKEEAQLQ